jgi:hypothetical protein
MVRDRYMSLLGAFDDRVLEAGIAEIDARHPGPLLRFDDRYVFVRARRPDRSVTRELPEAGQGGHLPAQGAGDLDGGGADAARGAGVRDPLPVEGSGTAAGTLPRRPARQREPDPGVPADAGPGRRRVAATWRRPGRRPGLAHQLHGRRTAFRRGRRPYLRRIGPRVFRRSARRRGHRRDHPHLEQTEGRQRVRPHQPCPASPAWTGANDA